VILFKKKNQTREIEETREDRREATTQQAREKRRGGRDQRFGNIFRAVAVLLLR